MFLLNLLFSLASATTVNTTFEQPWYLTRASAPDSLTGAASAISVYDLGFCEGSGCPHYGESGVITTAVARNGSNQIMTGWNYVKCIAVYDAGTDTARYFMSFVAQAGSWPSNWPATLKCTATEAGDTITALVEVGPAIDSDWVGDPMGTITIAGGKTILREEAADGARVGAIVFAQKLPSGTYVDGTIQAKKSGVNWTGVKCIIDERGTTDYIDYQISEGAVAGTGSCTFSQNGSNVTSPVVVQDE